MPHRRRFPPHRPGHEHRLRHEHPAPPPRYVIVLKPQTADAEGHPEHGPEVRTTPVEATGELGASGYPRYAGDGVVADVDPRTRTVEAATVDGAELPYGWVALVADENGDRGGGNGGDGEDRDGRDGR